MSRPATGSRAFFGGPPWWVVIGLPVVIVLGLWALQGLGMPAGSSLLLVLAVLLVVQSVIAVLRRGWATARRVAVVPGGVALLAGAAVMGSGLTVNGIEEPWTMGTYFPGVAALLVVLVGLQYLLNRRHRATTADRTMPPGMIPSKRRSLDQGLSFGLSAAIISYPEPAELLPTRSATRRGKQPHGALSDMSAPFRPMICASTYVSVGQSLEQVGMH